jgi:hypothetical protein
VEVLHYDNRKISPLLWDASTKEKKAAAILALFRYLKDEWEVYSELAEPLAWDAQPSKQRLLDEKAVKGDVDAAHRLLTARKSYEYEYWSFIDVDDPQAKEWTE